MLGPRRETITTETQPRRRGDGQGGSPADLVRDLDALHRVLASMRDLGPATPDAAPDAGEAVSGVVSGVVSEVVSGVVSDVVSEAAVALPGLHLALVEDYRKLGDLPRARHHLAAAREAAAALPPSSRWLGGLAAPTATSTATPTATAEG